MRSVSRLSVMIAVAGLCVLAEQSRGAYVTMTLNSVTPRQSISTTHNGGSSWQTINTGRLNWTGALTNPAGLRGSFSAFCIELTQSVSAGTTYSNTYEVIPLATGPLPAAAPNQPMGVDSAQLIGNLWDKHYTSLSTSNDFAAFQLCIWEIIYDAGLDLGAGDFRMRNNSTVQNLAQGWLNGLDPKEPVSASLFSLSSPTKQDMLVPTPGAASLLAGGLLGLAGRRRRK
jgi:hypothetical protein